MTGRVQKNLEYWERTSDEYQAAHGQTLTQTAKPWGVWRIPEADLNVLGDLEGKNVLELGCGAAQWSLALSDAGVGAVGLDLSERQLSHARNACREAAGVGPAMARGEHLEAPERGR